MTQNQRLDQTQTTQGNKYLLKNAIWFTTLISLAGFPFPLFYKVKNLCHGQLVSGAIRHLIKFALKHFLPLMREVSTTKEESFTS